MRAPGTLHSDDRRAVETPGVARPLAGERADLADRTGTEDGQRRTLTGAGDNRPEHDDGDEQDRSACHAASRHGTRVILVPRPMLAHSADELPQGREWTYEVKWDGYRAIAAKDDGRVKLLSRNQKDLTRDYPTVAAAIAALSAPSLQALQHRSTKGLTLVYVAFDLLTIGGQSLLKQPLDARRRRLQSVFAGAPPLLLLSEPL